MKIHHIRNATMVIETGEHVLLIDPMLGSQGTMPTLTLFRFKAQKNPIVHLPANYKSTLENVTHCLLTHQHPDHIDKKGIRYLSERKVPVTCSIHDEQTFTKKGLNVVQTIDYWHRTEFLGGKIEGIPARHGYGFVAKPMGKVMGFYLALPNEPSVYLSSDTIYTDEVDKVLKEYKPDVSVVATGSAQLDIFKPLLMSIEDIVNFVANAPSQVIANHMEAVNHCPTTRDDLKQRLQKEGLLAKIWIPADGDVREYK